MTGFENETAGTARRSTRAARGVRPLGTGAFMMAGVVVLLVGLLAGGVLGHLASGPTPAATTSDHVDLTIAFNPYTGLDEYFPANFTVPAGIPVTVTITNYDNGTNAVPAAFAAVKGTVDGTETVNGESVTSIASDQVTHTFTLITGPYDLNVPIPAAHDTTPTVVTFTAVFGATGVFAWHCMAPCDEAAMATPGFMTGSVTVTSG